MNEPLDRLPIWPTAIAGWRLVATRWRELFAMGWAPATLIIALDVLSAREDLITAPGSRGMLMYFAIWSAASAFLLVPWHRFVLLGQMAAGGFGAFSVRERHLRFIVRLVLIGLLWQVLSFAATASIGPESLMPGLLFATAGSVFVLYVTARLSLALPAAALGHDDSFGRAWRLSRYNGWRVLVAGILVLIPPFLLFMPLGFPMVYLMAQEGASPEEVVLFAILFAPFGILLLVAGAAVLSVAYRILGGMEEAPADEDAPTASP